MVLINTINQDKIEETRSRLASLHEKGRSLGVEGRLVTAYAEALSGVRVMRAHARWALCATKLLRATERRPRLYEQTSPIARMDSCQKGPLRPVSDSCVQPKVPSNSRRIGIQQAAHRRNRRAVLDRLLKSLLDHAGVSTFREFLTHHTV